MHAEDRRHHFLLGDQAATDRRRKSRDRGVARFHVIPVADIEPSEGSKFIQLGERCGARGWKNHQGTWLANGTAQGGIFTENSRVNHPTEPCQKAQSAPEGSGLALGVYGTLTARTLARSSLANPGSDPIPLRIPFPIGPRPKIGFWPRQKKPPAFCAGTFSGSCFLGLKPGLPSVGSFPLFPTAIITSGVNSTPPCVLF